MAIKNTICIDVDGTLLLWPGGNDHVRERDVIPTVRKSVKERIEYLYSRRHTVILWSANGKEHAEWAAKFANIEDSVSLCCAKPIAFIDDHYMWLDRITRIDPSRM